ncbi:MAG: hypothetical protein LBD84_05240 [Campylobacteraceae bacterium]|nr:hypothetical protein [Campylobacteraceae bacterium]
MFATVLACRCDGGSNENRNGEDKAQTSSAFLSILELKAIFLLFQERVLTLA